MFAGFEENNIMIDSFLRARVLVIDIDTVPHILEGVAYGRHAENDHHPREENVGRQERPTQFGFWSDFTRHDRGLRQERKVRDMRNARTRIDREMLFKLDRAVDPDERDEQDHVVQHQVLQKRIGQEQPGPGRESDHRRGILNTARYYVVVVYQCIGDIRSKKE
jgi:hypothetical protein